MDEQHLKDSHDTFPEHNFLRGAFLVSRSIDQSEVWFKDHIYLKAWVWMIGKANHRAVEKEGFAYQRGEFSTTYDDIREALRTYQHNKKHLPTLKRIRVMLDWFGEKGMIEKTPLRKRQKPPISHPFPTQTNGFTAGHGAYAGLKIKIVNYDLYQTLDNYEGRPKGRDRGRGRADQGHNNKNEEKNEEKNGRNSISSKVSDEALRLAQLLLDSIRECNPDFKPSFDQKDLDRWACDIDLMMRIDKRSPDQIREVIAWVKGDSFWWMNIQSGEKLRKKFDRLVAQMKSPAIGKKVTHDGIAKGAQRLKDAFRRREGRTEHKPLEPDFKPMQGEGFFPESD